MLACVSRLQLYCKSGSLWDSNDYQSVHDGGRFIAGGKETKIMKKILGVMVVLALTALFVTSADAINISSASVQNGLAAVSGGKAASNSSISWEGGIVTTANKNGGFSFSFGVVPSDCVGRLSDGVTGIDVALSNCTPVSTAIAPAPKTGVTTSYAAGDDGALKKGVAWPNPRFTDNSNGTVTDNLTGLVWLKNANCPGPSTSCSWTGAFANVASLNSTGTMNSNEQQRLW